MKRPPPIAVLAIAIALSPCALAQAPRAVLTGLARMPAETFASGPPSGAFRGPNTAAFPGQPVQGFSAIRPVPGDRDGWWFALTDNGYGVKANSRDFLLRIYRVRPHWPRSRQGSVGRVDVAREFIQLADPDRRVPFAIVNDQTGTRLLTGADFDPESFVVGEDGSFWIGDEFGPFLLHVDSRGRLIDAPLAPPGIRSPDHPEVLSGARPATVGRSKGFEGLAGPDGSDVLYAALEGGVQGDAPATTRILEFDRRDRKFTGTFFTYAFDADGHSLTELVAIERARGKAADPPPLGLLTIERDDGQGPEARYKRVFSMYLESPSRDAAAGRAIKHEVLDLLSIANPSRLGEFGPLFSFPFITTEAVWPIAPDVVVLVNDNNYPGTGGRGKDVKDATEFIRVKLVRPLIE